jgi:pSer/pThr/pTyr-binding forkhead associated (FHA) protein
MYWRLLVDSGSNPGQVMPITRPVTWVGRGDGCHIRPTSLAVSRRHCVLLYRRGKLYVSACPTTNGTFVNGRRVEGEVELQDGDRLQLGPVTLAVCRCTVPAEGEAPVVKVSEDPVAAELLDQDTLETRETPVPARS